MGAPPPLAKAFAPPATRKSLFTPPDRPPPRPRATPWLFHMGPCPLLTFVFSAFGSKNSLPPRRRKRPMPFGRPLDAEPALRVILIL